MKNGNNEDRYEENPPPLVIPFCSHYGKIQICTQASKSLGFSKLEQTNYSHYQIWHTEHVKNRHECISLLSVCDVFILLVLSAELKVNMISIDKDIKIGKTTTSYCVWEAGAGSSFAIHLAQFHKMHVLLVNKGFNSWKKMCLKNGCAQIEFKWHRLSSVNKFKPDDD